MDAPEPPRPPSPMAPSLEAWAALSEAERARVLATLVPIPDHEALPPEGDDHIDAWMDADDALQNWFRAKKKKAYLGRGITVYYPERPRFAPDLFVVLDAEPGPRTTWVVNREGRTLDFVLEVHAEGDKKKDLQRNVARFAELGIPEYVVYDARRHTLTGYRLEEKGRPYVPVMQQGGRWRSEVLGLWLGVREGRLRFFDELHVIPFERELHAELAKALAEVSTRAEAEAARAEAEAARAEAEATRAASLEAEVARLRALLATKGEGT